jgi:hypothetical protein
MLVEIAANRRPPEGPSCLAISCGTSTLLSLRFRRGQLDPFRLSRVSRDLLLRVPDPARACLS